MRRRCCCGGGCTTTVSGTVTGCGVAKSGLTVTLKNSLGTTLGTTTTNGSGQYTFTASQPGGSVGSVTVTAAAESGFQNTTGSFTFNCASVTRNVSLTLASGYSCSPSGCCPTGEQTGPPYGTITWPSSVTLNDGFGNVTLNNTSMPGVVGAYVGTATRTAGDAADCDSTPVPCDIVNNVSVEVTFTLLCDVPGGGWTLYFHVSGCPCLTSPAYSQYPGTGTTATQIYECGTTTANADHCPPSMSWTFTAGFSTTRLRTVYTGTTTFAVTQ